MTYSGRCFSVSRKLHLSEKNDAHIIHAPRSNFTFNSLLNRHLMTTSLALDLELMFEIGLRFSFSGICWYWYWDVKQYFAFILSLNQISVKRDNYFQFDTTFKNVSDKFEFPTHSRRISTFQSSVYHKDIFIFQRK